MHESIYSLVSEKFKISNSIPNPTPLHSMDSIDFIINFAQSIVKFIQILLNHSLKTLLNAFDINLNSN